MSFMHIFHVFFYFGDVSFCEFDWDQISYAVLKFKFIPIQAIMSILIIV